MTLYADFFKEGNFCLPMTKFFWGNSFLIWNTYLSDQRFGPTSCDPFELTCRAQRLVLMVDIFNVSYYVSYTISFYLFNS
ncbi:hypothetical protein Hanom_Chr02g00123621 [Helianthus anomalus]